MIDSIAALLTTTVWGGLALILTPVSYLPYFISIYRGRTKPHAFTWLIWGVLTTIAFFAQIVAGAGPGAWVTAATAVFCLIITGIAFSKADKDITRSDKIALAIAILSLPIWWVTNDPLYAILIVTLIDAIGFYPTFRKTWHRPHEEDLTIYTISIFKFSFAVLGLETLNLTTALYPASIAAMSVAFVILGLWRRNVLRVNSPKDRI